MKTYCWKCVCVIHFIFLTRYENTWILGATRQHIFIVRQRMFIWWKGKHFSTTMSDSIFVYDDHAVSQHYYRFKNSTFHLTRISVVRIVALVFRFIQVTLTSCWEVIMYNFGRYAIIIPIHNLVMWWYIIKLGWKNAS